MNFGLELDVFLQVILRRHVLEVSPYFLGGRVEVTPIWIFLPCELITMTWYVASAAWVPVLQPRSSNVMVLLIDLKLNILEEALSLVRDLQPSSSSTNTDHADVPFGMKGLFCDAVAIEVLIIPLVLVMSVASWNRSISVRP